MHTAAVILAAGLSRRMGKTDKLKLHIDGIPMYQHVISLVATSGLFSDVIVVTNQRDIAAFAQTCGAQPVENPLAEQGQGTSVAAGARALPEDTDFCAFFTADQPFLTKEILKKLTSTAEQTGNIIVPRVGGVPKSPCIFPKRFFAQCKALSGEKGGKGIYQQHLDEVVWVDFPDNKAWRDIDTAGDYNAIISGALPQKQDATHGIP
ncbi:MAG: nucleotidyltransferase family protein [Eubacteriales bacterium]|nr:nucleotidyltransferase family protein [Eubacteriales bacterium]